MFIIYFLLQLYIYVLKYTISYVHCVDLLILSPMQLDFPVYDFSVIYYDFSKLLQRVI
jgi:hypothetical protein